LGQGLDDRFTRIHPTMNPPVPRSGTRSVFPGVTGGSSLDELRSQYKWNQGSPTNFPSGEGLVPLSHTEESQFQDYVTESQRDRLTWPGDPSPWPAGDSEGPAAPRPTAAPIDQGLGSLEGTAPAPSGISMTPDWLAQNIPALGSLPSLVYTDPNTGQTVDMRPEQTIRAADEAIRTPGGDATYTIGYTPYDHYTFNDGTVVGSHPGVQDMVLDHSRNVYKMRPYRFTGNQLNPIAPTIYGRPLYNFTNLRNDQTTNYRPW
jgi:hypothetical protein